MLPQGIDSNGVSSVGGYDDRVLGGVRGEAVRMDWKGWILSMVRERGDGAGMNGDTAWGGLCDGDVLESCGKIVVDLGGDIDREILSGGIMS